MRRTALDLGQLAGDRRRLDAGPMEFSQVAGCGQLREVEVGQPMRFRDRMYVVFAVWALALVAIAMAA